MTLFFAIFSATMLAQTLRTTIPYACAALGGVWSEKSGVINIALEGLLLSSGLAAVIAHHATGNPWIGVASGVACGAFLAGVHAMLVVVGEVDAIVSGIALNLMAAGGTRFVLRAVFGSSSNSPAIEGFRTRSLDGSSGVMLLARTLADPLALITVLLALATGYVMYKTRFGLRVRASGEEPVAAASVGIAVNRMRILSVVLGGAICGIGGVALAYDQHQFQSGMSGGRGFIALAAVILGGWRPMRAVVACLLFAALDALQIVLQGQARVPTDVVQMLPYLVTLIALFLVMRRGGDMGKPPRGLGKAAA
ncbi:MAG: ABC transporter permease [Polyangiaceae bacterium]